MKRDICSCFRPPILFAFIFAMLPVCRAHSAASQPPVEVSREVVGASSCKIDSPGIVEYIALQHDAPHLFHSPGQWQRGEISLLLDPETMCAVQSDMYRNYRRKMNHEEAWSSSRAGVILRDPYFIVLRDVVRFPNGKTGLYDRKVTRSTLDGGTAGAFCLPRMADGRFVLVKEYRHQERAWRLSIPGGFRDPGESAEQAARREASEETKLSIGQVALLGQVDAEGEAVPLFLGHVVSQPNQIFHQDEGEAIAGTVLLSLEALKKIVVDSGYRDEDGSWLFVHGNLGTAVLMAEHALQLPSRGSQKP